MRRLWTVTAACALAACSGAGKDDGPALTFSPAPLRVTFWGGDRASAAVSVGYRNMSGQLSIRVVDREGILEGEIGLEHFPQQARYVATLHLSTALAAGSHTGALEVWVCRDSPTLCRDAVSGSPWLLPYEITVRPGTNLTPLAALPLGRPWSTYQGTAAHDGHVPAPTLAPAAFTRRWKLPLPTTAIAASGGRVFAATYEDATLHWWLRAIDEGSGQELWSRDLGRLSDGVRGIAVAGGRVFATYTRFDPYVAELLVLDELTGDTIRTYASGGFPVPFEGAVYGGPGNFRLELPDLTQTWQAQCDPSLHLRCAGFGVAAVDGDRVYAQAVDALVVWRRADGTQEAAIVEESFGVGAYTYETAGAPVLGGDGTVYVTQHGATVTQGKLGRLVAWDVVGRRVKWTNADTFRSNPVLAGGTLYVEREALAFVLEALDPATGALRWSRMLGSSYTSDWPRWPVPPQVVVVGNLAFVTAAESVAAIDVDTKAQVWTHPSLGRMAVSENGVLYIATDEALYAINLAFAAQ